MGLFSKLMKDVAEAAADKKWEDAVDRVRSNETFKDLTSRVKAGVNMLESEAAARADMISEKLGREGSLFDGTAQAEPYYDPEVPAAASGDSYGPVMPEEPNQYNYDGPFTDYFEDIFREEFPDLRFESEEIRPFKQSVYSFYSCGRKALVIELLSETCHVNKVRNACGREGIPYLRFYTDHDGWWNTRSYVIRRMRAAIEG